MGALLIVSSQSFRKIVQTQGNDVANLMKALENLSNVFLIRTIALVFAAVVLGLILGFVVVLLSVSAR